MTIVESVTVARDTTAVWPTNDVITVMISILQAEIAAQSIHPKANVVITYIDANTMKVMVEFSGNVPETSRLLEIADAPETRAMCKNGEIIE